MHRATLPLLLAAGAAATACGDATGISLDDLAGTWNASKFEFTPQTGGASFDIIANGGAFTITVQATGRYTGQISFLGSTDNFSGTIAIRNDSLVITDDDEPNDPVVFAQTLSGNVLTITTRDAEFDFPPPDGTDDPATLVIVLIRQ